jgi:hypothetical protein
MARANHQANRTAISPEARAGRNYKARGEISPEPEELGNNALRGNNGERNP